MTMTTLALGAALYFDYELASDPLPLITLWSRIATQAELCSWILTPKGATKPVDFDATQLVRRIESGVTTTVGIETRNRDVTIIASTARAASLDRRPPAPRWSYDLAVVLGAERVAALGRDAIVNALCDFAGAVAATAGVVVWSASLDFARALALLSSGPDLRRQHVSALVDAQLNRSHWGNVIRGPEWGTFLSASLVAKLEGRALPAARTVALTSGGAFVQVTAEPFDVEAPPRILADLREALAPVMGSSGG
jgi:hypothetical protein